jgi:hypothetical protein
METKTIFLDTVKNKKVVTERPKKKRMITAHRKWDFDETTLNPEYQTNIVRELIDDLENNSVESTQFIKQLIHTKIHSYGAQDKEKGIYNDAELVTYKNVLELFKMSDMKCYYCKESTLILYEHVRDPKQWTLERMNNRLGHNRGNVSIACLQCYLRRRTMHSNRYLQTKELMHIKKTGL